MKNIFLLLIVLSVFLFSCNVDKNGFETHESGLKYKIVFTENGAKPNIGDVLILRLSYETESGKELFNSTDTDRKYLRKLEPPKHTGGSIEDGLALMSVGDSTIFKINAESFLKSSESFSNLPAGVKSQDLIIIKVKLLEVLKHEQFDSHLSEKYHQSEEVELEILETYLKNANINVEPTESGMYFIEQHKGSNIKVEPGNTVSVHYTVKFIDGLVLETTYNRAPIKFTFGDNQMIEAWNEGIGMMNEGGQAMLICPSKLAYGEKGTNDIPPYSTLIFEIEIISVQK
ncbi:MAG: FKBP-type peptidyl-prolyl cis-trans isomerase [Bacteroidales bacterium]|nr:FKBP-type peptidyl-prolyl cis-trans isomerase [Bacteroidales bacterium]